MTLSFILLNSKGVYGGKSRTIGYTYILIMVIGLSAAGPIRSVIVRMTVGVRFV